jgi:hypothetical protein
MHLLSSSCTFVLAVVLALPTGTRAEPAEACGSAQDQPDNALEPRLEPQSEAAAPSADGQLGTADDDLLAATRGGSDLTTIDTTLSGTVSGNSANNVFTGSNIIQSGSFANMSGIPIIVQNTGANVLIQNATVINLQLK